jgi:hypoxia up-regulated 1
VCPVAEAAAVAGDYWQALAGPLKDLVERNQLTADSNLTLQLLGGGSRVPRVRAELATVLDNLNLERQLDADEAFALGAGLYAANLSTVFRLRQFGMYDGNMFPVHIGIDSAAGVPDHLEVRRSEPSHLASRRAL